MKILITGATGNVGGGVVRALTGSGHDLAVLVRDPASYDAPEGVEVIQGDLTVADDVRRALTGVDRAFLNMADDNGAVFAEVAGEIGLEHAVLLSSYTAVTKIQLGDANIVTQRHRAGEKALTDAGVPATFLRSAGFTTNYLWWTSEVGSGVVRAPWLDAKLPIIDPDDVGAAAAAVLTAQSPSGGAYSITGSEPLSVTDQTAIAAEVLGRDIRVEPIDLAVAKSNIFPEGTPALVVDSVFGAVGPEASVLPVSNDFEALTGRPPRTFAQWVERNPAVFV